MRTPASVLGHPIHALSIPLPLGSLSIAVLVDILNLVDERQIWKDAAYVFIGLGILAGLIVAIPGLIDWLSIPEDHPAKRVGIVHALSNVTGLGLFTISWFLRYGADDNWSGTAMVFSLLGLAALVLGGWFGGELVYRHQVGVQERP